MKILSWNVNGVRAVVKKGLFDWLESESPDVVCLQYLNQTYTVIRYPLELGSFRKLVNTKEAPFTI